MPDTKYLKRRGQTWSVVVHVPRKLHEAAGCSEFVKALGTRDLRVAQRERHRWIDKFQRRIEELKQAENDSDRVMVARALKYRERLKANKGGAVFELPDGEEISDYEEVLDDLKGVAKDILRDEGSDAAGSFYTIATGEASLLKDFIPLWQQEHEKMLGADTVKAYLRALREFLDWASDSVTVEEIDRRKAGTYVTHLSTATKRAPGSVATYVNKLSGFWRWLSEKGFADESNPWRGHRLSRSSTVQKRKALEDNELVQWLTLKNGGKYQTLYHDAVRLILVTGLRIGLC